MAEAEKSAEARRKELTEQARAEVGDARRQWTEAVGRERDHFLGELRRRAGEEACRVVGAALSDLAGEDLEERMVGAFLKRIGGLEGEERTAFEAFLAGKDGALAVRSTHELSEDVRGRVAGTLRELAGREVETVFETSPEVICGLELVMSGRKIGWSMGEYLSGIEDRFAALIGSGEESGGGDVGS
jgi:F-type H+-transporting ATPase subunit b